MRDTPTASAVYTVHLTRHGVLVALLGVVAIVVGLFAPLSAQAGDNQGGGVDPGSKPWICHPVEGAGETGYGWNLIDPSKDSSHIDEATGAGTHTRKDGTTDVYAGWDGTSWTCPGGPTSPTTEPTSPTTRPTTEPPPTTTTEPTTEPPTTTDTPSTGATSSSTSTASSSTSSPAVPPEETPEDAATVAPTPTQGEPPAEEPEVGATEENAVPEAQTDGADLVGQATGWTALQSTLVGGGLLLLVAGGLLSVRREQVEE